MEYLALPPKDNPHRFLAETFIRLKLKDLYCKVSFAREKEGPYITIEEPSWAASNFYKLNTGEFELGPKD